MAELPAEERADVSPSRGEDVSGLAEGPRNSLRPRQDASHTAGGAQAHRRYAKAGRGSDSAYLAWPRVPRTYAPRVEALRLRFQDFRAECPRCARRRVSSVRSRAPGKKQFVCRRSKELQPGNA